MPTEFRFTNASVKSFKNTTGKQLFVYDELVTGFALTVSPGGKKCFYYCGRIKGKPERIKLGEFPGLLVEPAREAARQIIGEVACGRDAAHRRRIGRSTLDDLWQHFFTTYSKPRKRTWERDLRDYERFLKADFGSVLVSAIERADVVKLVAHIEAENGKGPARKIRAMLGTMFKIGIRDGLCESNPTIGVARPDFSPRQRYLKVEEVEAFMTALDSLKSQLARDYLLMLPATGQRRSNVASMEWTELDFTANTWTIPSSKYKAKRAHVVPLADLAMEILERRRAARRPGSPWVFPRRGHSGKCFDPKSPWNRVKAYLKEHHGISNLRMHDLRRSLGAWQQHKGASLRITQVTLGHATPDITAAFYSPLEGEHVREAVNGALPKALAAAGRVAQ